MRQPPLLQFDQIFWQHPRVTGVVPRRIDVIFVTITTATMTIRSLAVLVTDAILSVWIEAETTLRK
jgi:hypothetical protein